MPCTATTLFQISDYNYPTLKLHRIPAQIAEPITPEELQAMACMSKKLEGSSFWPIKWTSRADPGTADTPAGPQERVDLFLQKQVHDFGENQTGCRSDTKSNCTEVENTNGFGGEKNISLSACAHRETKENGSRVDNGTAGRFDQPVDNTANLQQIAEKEGSQQRNRSRGYETTKEQPDHRKHQQLFARNRGAVRAM